MASQGNDMVGSPNKFLLEIIGNLKFFAQNIMCVRETFDSSQTLLKKQLDATKENLAQFIQLNNISQNEGKVVISNDKRKSYLNLQRIKERAEQAVRLIPPSYLVSLVSLFDSFYAGLVRCILKGLSTTLRQAFARSVTGLLGRGAEAWPPPERTV